MKPELNSVPQLHVVTPLDTLKSCVMSQPETVLAGYAGTGKTWNIQHLLKMPGVVLCAPTAKAKLRLEEVTGHKATTIHGLIYGAPDEQWIRPDGTVCKGWTEQRTCPNVACRGGRLGDIDEGPTCKTCGGAGKLEIAHEAPGCPGCLCKPRISFDLGEDGKLDDVELVIVDEASMVSEKTAADIRTAVGQIGARILWAGDPGQLPPVDGDPGVNLHSPDVLLTKVHRNDGGILAFVTDVRSSTGFGDLERIVEQAMIGHYTDVTVEYGGVDALAVWRSMRSQRMAIVHTNRQRVECNAKVREALRREGPLVRGDRVLIRKNMRVVPVWNGEVYVVQSVARVGDDPVFTVLRVTLDGDPKAPTRTIVVREDHVGDLDAAEFGRQWPAMSRDFRQHTGTRHGQGCTFFDGGSEQDCPPTCEIGALHGLHLVNAQHGFVITCHAAQGSESKEVAALWTPRTHRDRFESARSWLYTAGSRAREKLTICVD